MPVKLFPRQDRETAERAHEEEMASASLSARERERELTVLLEQTEAQHQQRGQCFHTQRWHWAWLQHWSRPKIRSTCVTAHCLLPTSLTYSNISALFQR